MYVGTAQDINYRILAHQSRGYVYAGPSYPDAEPLVCVVSEFFRNRKNRQPYTNHATNNYLSNRPGRSLQTAPNDNEDISKKDTATSAEGEAYHGGE